MNNLTTLLEAHPDDSTAAYVASSLCWNNGWPEQNQRLIDALRPLGYVIAGGPDVNLIEDAHPSLDTALRAASGDDDGRRVLASWVKESEAHNSHKNPATFIPLMASTAAGRQQLQQLIDVSGETNR